MKKQLRTSLMAVWSGMAVLVSSPAAFAAADGPSASTRPYKVVDGTKVDAPTFNGWKTWRSMACERCHGANQEGMVGPSLIESLKTMTNDQFKQVVLNGRPEKGMPNFAGSKVVVDNIDALYGYLKGRSDGQIKPGRVGKME